MKFPRPHSVEEIASFINARFTGPSDFSVTGINEIHVVEPGDLTFVDHPKYYSKALNSRATTILINKEVEAPEGKALIISEDPFRDFIILGQKFMPFRKASRSVSESAEIGEGTTIQPGAFIGNNVTIGKNCLIHSNASIYDHTVIGDNVIIHSNTVIGADAYYFQKRKEGLMKFESCGRVILEDNVEIGALCSIDRGVTGDTVIGRGTKFDNHVQVGHDTRIGKDCLIGAHCAIAGVTTIEDEVILWGRVSVDKDLVIGKGAVMLGTSATDKDLAGGKVYFGAPAMEARKKWREMAAVKQLPELIQKLRDK